MNYKELLQRTRDSQIKWEGSPEWTPRVYKYKDNDGEIKICQRYTPIEFRTPKRIDLIINNIQIPLSPEQQDKIEYLFDEISDYLIRDSKKIRDEENKHVSKLTDEFFNK